MVDPGEQTTGTRDEHYNLISVLYHALHGAETIEAYILDAEAVGDERLAEFFRETQATHRQLAERAKGLLGIGGGLAPEADDAAPGSASLGAGVPPATEPQDLPPDAPTEEIPTTSNVPRTSPGGTEDDTTAGPPAGEGLPAGDVPPRTAQSGWDTPPPRPRRASPADTTPPDDVVVETGDVVPDHPAESGSSETPDATPEDAPRGTTPEPPPETQTEPPPPGPPRDANPPA